MTSLANVSAPMAWATEVDSFLELTRLLLPVSSLSAQRAALVRQDLRALAQEARRARVRPAVCHALMASVADELEDGVSKLSIRALRARLRPFVEAEPAPA